KVPSDDLVNLVQEEIDPIQNQGEGLGLAPIGHRVTVEGVTSTTINISAEITYKSGYTWENIKTIAEEAINDYLNELNMSWEDEENLIVRISQIETRLLSIDGVLDITNTMINEVKSNLIIDSNSIVVRGEVVG
ncbi:TPA: baseplate J/gp47 family protein, partial [Clostridioides difficile]|nr:baseplate J/gp47 family protein [Clostridioides difficile]